MNKGMLWIVMISVLLMARLVLAGPLGPEFQVNTYTSGSQTEPSVGMDGMGNFVIAWRSDGQDGSYTGVYAQRYDTSGNPQGDEFLVNTYTTGYQVSPAVGMNDAGNFIIVWSGEGPGGNDGVFAKRYDASGTAQGSEFQVNTSTSDDACFPAVCIGEAGNFVIAWSSSHGSSSFNVYAQRYDAAGIALGGEFQVNTYWDHDQWFPAVDMDGAGNFVITWASGWQDGDAYGVYAQRYNASGIAQGSEFRVNTYTPSYQSSPSIGMDESGEFIIAWSSYGQDGSYTGVYAQRYDAFGNPQGNEFQVNTYYMNHQWYPSVGINGMGDFIIVWMSTGQDNSNDGIYAQRYNESGTAKGIEFRVNSNTIEHQFFPPLEIHPSVGMDGSGNFVVAWYTDGQDGDGEGVYARCFKLDTILPTVDVINSSTTNPTNSNIVSFDVAFSEDVVGFDAATDLVINETGTTMYTNIMISGGPQNYTVDMTGISGDGDLMLSVNTASDIEDLEGNPLASSVTSAPIIIDNTPPSINISDPLPVETTSGPVVYMVTYIGEEIVFLTEMDITLDITGDVLASVMVTPLGGSNWEVLLFDISGVGTLGFSVAANTASDAAGNLAIGASTTELVQVIPPVPLTIWPVGLALLAVGIIMLSRQRRLHT
jgi:hypothetical protein